MHRGRGDASVWQSEPPAPPAGAATRTVDQLGRAVGAVRLLINGSFVTGKAEPEDVDAVMLLPPDFAKQLEQGAEEALELEQMFLTRQPEEIFAAEEEADFEAWCEFFSRTREADGRRKGLLEIVL